MGGYGSGRWGWGKSDAKTLVEDCLVLDVADLVRRRAILPEAIGSGSWRWSRGGEPYGSIGFETRTTADGGTIRLRYRVTRAGEEMSLDYAVPLETTPYPNGGRRWWLRCVASRGAGPRCGRRVRKLYLPPGGTVFACRACYDLAYRSSRESRKYDGLFRVLAAMEDLPLGDVKAALGANRKLRDEAHLQKQVDDRIRKARRVLRRWGVGDE